MTHTQGRIQDFKLGGAHLNNFFGGISCEKSRFYAKKNHICSNFRGAPGAPPPSWIRPWVILSVLVSTVVNRGFCPGGTINMIFAASPLGTYN